MIAYLDSSALVKLVVEESGSDQVALLWDGADTVVSSRVAHAEVCAALAAARRGGRLGHDDHETARDLWGDYRRGLHLVDVTSPVSDHAGTLAGRHALSGFDAIHLASALLLGPEDTVLATWDRRLHSGGADAGLATFPADLRR